MENLANILTEADGPPVETMNAEGDSEVLLLCEHASNRIPRRFGDLGVDADTHRAHVAWDPGAAEVARGMSATLDAPLVMPRFSRLIYDCNRPLHAESAIAARSEIYDIPGNTGLSQAERQARCRAIYLPFRNRVEALIAERCQAGRPPVLVTVHSFTPVYLGHARPTRIGVVHDADARLANVVFETLQDATGLQVARNDPYGPEDGVTHSLRVYALGRGLLNVMFEIRSDLIATAAAQAEVAALLSATTTRALTTLRTRYGVAADRLDGATAPAVARS